MHWDSTLNGGFSSALKTFRPVINTVEYGYKKINVASEKRDKKSLLNFIAQIIALRKRCAEMNNGEWRLQNAGTDHVLAIQYNDKGKKLLVCHNFSDQPQKASIKLARDICTATGLINRQTTLQVKGELKLNMEAYGFQWYRLN